MNYGQTLQLPAPAKLNLFLHVTGRRPDGYHLLETVFELIDLADQVTLQRRADGLIERIDPLPGVNPEHDLTVRAARLLAASSGCTQGVSIGLEKRIPMGAGLGGGSSDAATVLMGLNRLWGLGLNRQALAELGLRLGADVPFFIFGRTAYATGIGEVLEPCAQPARTYLLVSPGVGVATPRVFSDPGLTRDTKPLRIFGLLRSESSGAKAANFAESLEESGLHVDQEILARGRNDLQAVVERLFPQVGQALAELSATAEALGIRSELPRMSGSGSTVFLPVPESQLDAAVRHIKAGAKLPVGANVLVARSVGRHPLYEWAFA